MNSQELADKVAYCVSVALDEARIEEDEAAHVIADAQSRILGVGAQQYTEGDKQRFETMPLQDLIEYVREEALDLVNYGVMLTLRIERLAVAVQMADGQVNR